MLSFFWTWNWVVFQSATVLTMELGATGVTIPCRSISLGAFALISLAIFQAYRQRHKVARKSPVDPALGVSFRPIARDTLGRRRWIFGWRSKRIPYVPHWWLRHGCGGSLAAFSMMCGASPVPASTAQTAASPQPGREQAGQPRASRRRPESDAHRRADPGVRREEEGRGQDEEGGHPLPHEVRSPGGLPPPDKPRPRACLTSAT